MREREREIISIAFFIAQFFAVFSFMGFTVFQTLFTIFRLQASVGFLSSLNSGCVFVLKFERETQPKTTQAVQVLKYCKVLLPVKKKMVLTVP